MTADDEKLLQQLGRFARADQSAPVQAQLDRLSSSDLPEQELAALRLKTSKDAELERALAAYEPLSSAATAQIAQRVLAITRERASAVTDADADADADADVEDADAEDDGSATRGHVLPLHARTRSTRRPGVLWVGLPLSAAAAALLWFGTARHPIAALPAYQLEVSGGQAEVRSTPGAVNVGAGDMTPVRVGHDTSLHLLLRPDTAATSEVTARVYLASTSHPPIEWPAQIERAESGALQLVLAAPPGPIDGTASALVLVGDTAVIDTRGAELVAGQATRGDGFQRWRIPLVTGAKP